jgi:hypothetical protein
MVDAMPASYLQFFGGVSLGCVGFLVLRYQRRLAYWLGRDKRDIEFAGYMVLAVGYVFFSYWLFLRILSMVERFLP